jgi:hypothetical protein
MTKLGNFDDPTSAGITIIVFLCLFILFNKILKLNLGSTTALVFFAAFVLYFSNQKDVEHADLNQEILHAYVKLERPSGLQFDPDLILLFHKLLVVVKDIRDGPHQFNDNVIQAATYAGQVLIIHNHISKVSNLTDGAVHFQNALDLAKECINAIHSCIYSSDHPLESDLILKVLESVREILDDYLEEINDKINSNFVEHKDREENVYAQFIEPKDTKPLDPAKASTFDYFQ